MGRFTRWPTVWICAGCRRAVLQWLVDHDCELSHHNPIIQELCDNSHAIPKEAWAFSYEHPRYGFRQRYIHKPGAREILNQERNMFDELDDL